MNKQLPHNLILNDLYKDIQRDMDEVEGKLKQIAKSPNPLVSEANTYLFKKAGKRIRPALLILCSKLFDYQGKDHIFWSAIVELIHTASLIHDDIVDNSPLRRGKETAYIKWGPNITVLLGDYFYIKSIALSLNAKKDPISDILSDVSTKMIEGELLELYLNGNLDIAESQYLDILEKKTAGLFSASCQIGGLLGNSSSPEARALQAYGTNLGMSFQIIDDLLDFTADEHTLGKPILSDLNEGRITLPLIYTLNHDGKANRGRLTHLLKHRQLEKDSMKEILDIVMLNGALDYTHQKAAAFSRKSKEIIAQFPKSAYQETLSLMADFVLNRKK